MSVAALVAIATLGVVSISGVRASQATVSATRSVSAKPHATSSAPDQDDTEPPSFVSMEVPEGVMLGETLVAEVTCSRATTASDQPWLSFRSSGLNTEVPIVTAKMITFTDAGFTVRLPVAANTKTGAFQAVAGCQGPEIELGATLPDSAVGPPQWVIIRPNKPYSAFVSVNPTEAVVGRTVTFTIVCTRPPENAGLFIAREGEAALIDITSPDGYSVKGSTLSITATIPANTPAGDYPMEAYCDGPSDTFDYYPPPSSYGLGLTFEVLPDSLPPLL